MLNLLLDNPCGPDGCFNVGDDIQVLAAKGHMSSVDRFIVKEKLRSFDGPSAKILLNGWFAHSADIFPISENITPLITSFHLTPCLAEALTFKPVRAFFLLHGPIGCRDHETLRIFQGFDIPAFYSGCLTLTLKREDFVNSSATRCGIYEVDVLYKMRPRLSKVKDYVSYFLKRRFTEDWSFRRARRNILRQVVGDENIGRVQSIEHSIALKHDSREMRHAAAIRRLQAYANAELVVTSRIHCALPCLAFGTPVIFVDGALEDKSERARLDGIAELFNTLTWDAPTGALRNRRGIKLPLDIQKIGNPTKHVDLARRLSIQCDAFMATSARDTAG